MTLSELIDKLAQLEEWGYGEDEVIVVSDRLATPDPRTVGEADEVIFI